jgi:hypothetical protein
MQIPLFMELEAQLLEAMNLLKHQTHPICPNKREEQDIVSF